jgi:p-hydroxybenzoate 3-monooxygenase
VVTLDLILGYAGIVSLGHAAFFGVGAYAAGLLAVHGWGEPVTGLVVVGEAAHIVPPTGAKGLNLAASDMRYLFDGLIEHYRTGRSSKLDAYSERALKRLWKAERFSWWMTMLLHRLRDNGLFGDRIQRAELDYFFSSHAALTALAENFVGLPY